MKSNFLLIFISLFYSFAPQNQTYLTDNKVVNSISQTQNSKFYYTAFAIIKNEEVGKIMPTTATVTINSKAKTITVLKADNSKDVYFIKSGKQTAVTSSGNSYFTYLTTDNNYQYYFAFFENKLLITNKTTRNGLVLYK